jgi:hypothetical protein
MLHGEKERESVSVQRDMKLKIIFDHDLIYCDQELSIQDWQYNYIYALATRSWMHMW